MTATTSERPRRAGASRSRRLVGGGALLTAAMVVSGLGNYAINALLARWLSPEAFGDASLLVTLLLVVTAGAGCFQLVAARYTAEAVAGDDEASATGIRARLVRTAWFAGGSVAVLVSLAAPSLADAFGVGDPLVFVVFAAGVPLHLVQAVDRGVLQGRMVFGRLSLTYVAEMTVRLVASVAFVAAGWGLVGVAVALWASLAAAFVVARGFAGANRGVPQTPPRGFRGVVGITTVLLVAQIVISHGDLLLVKQRFAPAEAGTYAVVALLGRAVFLGSWSVATAAFPASAAGTGNEARVRRVLRGGLVLLAAMGFAATVGSWWLGPGVVETLFSADYTAAGSLLGPYVLATSLLTLANYAAMMDLARGRHRRAALMVAAAAAQTVLIAFAPTLEAVVWCQVAAMALLVAAMLVDARRHRGDP